MSHKKPVRPRAKPRFRRRTPPGAMPGLVVADPNAPPSVIRAIGYGPQGMVEEEVRDLADLSSLRGRHPVIWVHVMGLGDGRVIEEIGQRFHLHPLALEDVVNVHQRAKTEIYGDHLFVVVRTIPPGGQIRSEQLSIFCGKDFVVSFQEESQDGSQELVERIRGGRGQIRSAGTDYLTYALIDTAVDSYYPALERLGERLEDCDRDLAPRDAAGTLGRLHDLRNDLLLLRRSIWPHRDELNQLVRDSHPLIREETRVYLRDCYDHTVQILDLLETYREMCSDLRDLTVSMVSNRLNEIMKVLTIIATIFMPISFVASLYGMNFDTSASPWNMPELKWRYGYPFALAIIVATVAGMMAFFWHRGWLGNASGDRESYSPTDANHANLKNSSNSKTDGSPGD